jgi:hypothetical protein
MDGEIQCSDLSLYFPSIKYIRNMRTLGPRMIIKLYEFLILSFFMPRVILMITGYQFEKGGNQGQLAKGGCILVASYFREVKEELQSAFEIKTHRA